MILFAILSEIGVLIGSIVALLTFLFTFIFRRTSQAEPQARESRQALFGNRPRKAFRDLRQAPDVTEFFGRAEERLTLEGLIDDPVVNLVMVQGFGGVGKSTLVSEIARQKSKAFDVTIFRKLVSSPKLEVVLRSLLEGLQLPVSDSDQAVDLMTDRLLSHLDSKRALLILDNVESVIGPAAKRRGIAKDYEAFFEAWTNALPRATLILTGRRSPEFVLRHEGEKRKVRRVLLDGLAFEPARELMTSVAALRGSETDWRSLYEIYQGNALALELIARHVRDVYESDLREFLESGRAIVGDVEGLVTWHIDRLDGAELSVMYWLAIYREPVALEVLSESMLAAGERDNVAAAIQSLKAQIPIEQARDRFTLQPVLMEHMTDRLVRCMDGVAQLGGGDIDSIMLDRIVETSAREIENPASIQLLKRFALRTVHAESHIQDAQIQAIISPIIQRLTERFADVDLAAEFMFKLLDASRRHGLKPSYLAGNAVNIAREVTTDFSNRDFSRLYCAGADFTHVRLHGANFSGSILSANRFTVPLGSPFAITNIDDAETVAIGDSSGDITLVDLAEGSVVAHIDAHDIHIRALICDRRSGRLISGSEDYCIKIWNLDDYSLIRSIAINSNWINTLALIGPDRDILTASEDGTISRVSQVDGRVLWSTEIPGSCLTAVCISPSEDLIFGVDRQGGVWALEPDGERLRKLIALGERLTAIACDETRLFIGSAGGELVTLDLERSGLVSKVPAHGSGVDAVCFRSNEGCLITAGGDGVVRLWSLDGTDDDFILQRGASRIRDFCLLFEGKMLAACAEDQTLHAWNLETRLPTRSFVGMVDGLICLGADATGARAVTGGDNGQLKVWDLNRGQVEHEIKTPQYRHWAVDMSPDGSIFASGGVDRVMRIWDSDTLECLHAVDGHDGWIKGVSFDRVARTVLSVCTDGVAQLSTVSTGKCIWRQQDAARRYFGCALAPDAGLAALCDGSGEVLIVGESGEVNHVVPAHRGRARQAVFSTDSTRLFTCSEDRTIAEIDTASGEVVRQLYGAYDMIWFIDLCERTGKLAACDESNAVYLFSLETGELIHRMTGHSRRVYNVRFVAESSRLLSAGEDRTLRLWCADTGAAVAEFTYPHAYEEANFADARGLVDTERHQLALLGATT